LNKKPTQNLTFSRAKSQDLGLAASL